MNYVAIAVGAIIPMIMGMIWYHPKVLGTVWMKELGFTEEDAKMDNPLLMVGALALAGVISYAMSRYAGHTEEGMHQFVHGMFHGLMPALYYVVPVLGSKAIFEKNSMKSFLIAAVYWTLTLTLMGGAVYALTPVSAG